MKFGISFMTTDYSIEPTELAVAVEQRNFESLWFPEHTHIPTSRGNRVGLGVDGDTDARGAQRVCKAIGGRICL
jgi:alkanesulfonate monooxygenase SsuD/methylene tetrahydromethanopterin reductase-like flavin-dependent oxidoreductase (luciferase family)